MKKILLLSFLFFAIQNIILAQNDFGIILGGGLHNHDFISNTKSRFAPQAKVGISYQRNLINNRLQLSTSLNAHYFDTVNTLVLPVEPAHSTGYLWQATQTKSYFSLTLPILLSINLKKISVGGGVEYQTKTIVPNIGFGFIGNLQYRLSERLSINANYVRSLVDENREVTFLAETRTQRIEASIRYRLLKK